MVDKGNFNRSYWTIYRHSSESKDYRSRKTQLWMVLELDAEGNILSNWMVNACSHRSGTVWPNWIMSHTYNHERNTVIPLMIQHTSYFLQVNLFSKFYDHPLFRSILFSDSKMRLSSLHILRQISRIHQRYKLVISGKISYFGRFMI